MAQETTSDEADDFEPLNSVFTDIKDRAQTEWEETTITEQIDVLLPFGNEEELVEAAEETYNDDLPAEYRNAPAEVLAERAAEQVAETKFCERHPETTDRNIDTYAKNTGRTRMRRVDGEQIHFRVWEVLCYV